MSQTDLELCQELPKIRVVLSPKIKPIQTPEPSEVKISNVDLIIQRRNNNTVNDDKVGEEYEEESCRTPTSAEHRIPEMLTCPPAPRKPARAPACKRKLSEFEFLEAANRDEVEDFFRSSFVVVKAKRINSCPCK